METLFNTQSYKKNDFKNQFLIIHPFKSHTVDSYYINWNEASKIYNLSGNKRNIHLSILEYYYGLMSTALHFKNYNIITQEYYDDNIKPLCYKFKSISALLMPLDEELEFPIFEKIINLSGYLFFKVDALTAGEELSQELSIDDLRCKYLRYKSWEIESLNHDFYLKSFPDEIVTYVSFNLNDNLEKYLTDLGNKIDIIKIQ